MVEIKNIKYLLRDINIVRKKFEEREKSEDNFNMFTILRKESDEVYLHSRFLSALLDPNGPHRLGTIFLNSFLDRIESNFEYDEKSLEVYPNNQNRSEYKEIDICFIDRVAKKAVMVENKIYHVDTNHEDKGQLENYYGRLIEEDKISEDGIEVYYLTLDGHEPSEDSVKLSGKFPKLQDKVKCISYSVEILEWLRTIVKECYNKPSLRESIIQYIKIVEDMTNNDASIEEIKEIAHLIGMNEDNFLSTKFIIDNIDNVKCHIVIEFCKELEHELLEKGFKIVIRPKEDDLKNLIKGNQRTRRVKTKFIIEKEKYPIWINAGYDEWVHIGVFNDEDEKIKVSRSYQQKLKHYLSENDDYVKEGSWECWKVFCEDDNERICLSDFKYEGTFRLISPQYRKMMIQRLVNEVEKFINEVLKY